MTDKDKEEKYSRFLETESELKDKRIRNMVKEFDSLKGGDRAELVIRILKRYSEYRPALFQVGHYKTPKSFNVFDGKAIAEAGISKEDARMLLDTLLTVFFTDKDFLLDILTFTSSKYGIKLGYNFEKKIPMISKIPDSVMKINNDAMKSYETLTDKQTQKIIHDIHEELKKEGWRVAENKKEG